MAVIFRYLNQRYTFRVLRRHLPEEHARQLLLSTKEHELTERQAAVHLFYALRRHLFGISSSDVPALRAIQLDIKAVLSEPQQRAEKVTPEPKESDNHNH